ncbi:MAG: metallophosphoesterase family protein [Candidatus Heimdallarchaeota archaeon]
MRINTLSIGDTHGRNNWQVVDPTQYDYVIFVGDYFDSWDVSNTVMLDNIRNIIEFKKQNDNVILLLGNHDIHYLYSDPEFQGSGYRPEIALTFQEILLQNQDLFKIAFQIENVLWTHAGVNENWATSYLIDVPISEYANRLQEMLQVSKTRKALVAIGGSRGGFWPTGGPLWSDHYHDNIKNPIDGLVQIYGHTEVKDIIKIKKADYSLINIDCIAGSNKFYEYQINVIS